MRVRLTEKGAKFHQIIAKLVEQQIGNLTRANLSEESLGNVNEVLKRLERFWLTAQVYDLI